VIGQTWSTFSDPEAEPDGIDFEGLNAISLFRQPQVRWTKPLSTGTSLALSVENPNPDLTGAAGLNQVPDFIGRFRWEPRAKESGLLGFLRSGAHIQAAVLLRQLRGAPPDRPNDAVATGGAGINVSGRLEVPGSPDRDYITFAANAGQGIGRYITDLGTLGGQDTVYDPATNTLEALPRIPRTWATSTGGRRACARPSPGAASGSRHCDAVPARGDLPLLARHELDDGLAFSGPDGRDGSGRSVTVRAPVPGSFALWRSPRSRTRSSSRLAYA
jgi:hypothetical protein